MQDTLIISKIDKIAELFEQDIFIYLFIFVNVSSLTRLLVIQLVHSLSPFPFLHFYWNKLKCSFALF